MVQMLLPGIPICYYGDELGMENGTIEPKDIKDSFALRTKPVSMELDKKYFLNILVGRFGFFFFLLVYFPVKHLSM